MDLEKHKDFFYDLRKKEFYEKKEKLSRLEFQIIFRKFLGQEEIFRSMDYSELCAEINSFYDKHGIADMSLKEAITLIKIYAQGIQDFSNRFNKLSNLYTSLNFYEEDRNQETSIYNYPAEFGTD